MVTALMPMLLFTAAPNQTVRLLFSGDVTLGYHYEEYVDEQVAKGKSRDDMLAHGFAQAKDVTAKADLFVVNLECPFTTRTEKIAKNFNFKASPALVASLEAGGVDVVSLANNHLMDYGAEGLYETTATLDAAKIRYFGAGRNLTQARAPAIIEVKGLKFAFLGYFFLGDRNIEPPEVIATEKTPGVAGHHDDLSLLQSWVETDIRAAKANADFVIPFFHWGREGKSTPEPYQITLAHAAIDAGAAAVIGSHPHVLQGMESYQGAPIIYSLGNFVFGGNWDPKDKRTALVELTFTRQGYAGAKVLPARSDRFPDVPVQPYLVAGEEAASTLEYLLEISKALGKPLPALTKPSNPKR
ncbi:MAG: CapA family protein [Myxococcaceae bacterium]|nr:CapA family protein [Myxococcaceae bacterium]